MKKSLFKNAVLMGMSGFLLTPIVQAKMPVWTFSKPSPELLEVALGSTATVQYTITNQSTRAKDLILKTPRGILASSCYLPQKGSTCVLTLTIEGNNVPSNGLHGGPVLCERGNANQCYQPAAGSELHVQRVQAPNVTNNMAAVGFYFDNLQLPLSYYSEDSGKNWTASVVAAPPLNSDTNLLSNVSCTSNGACAAVGYYIDSSSSQQVPLSYYSLDFGKTWTLSSVLPPVQSLNAHTLSGVSCNELGNCAAVGSYVDNLTQDIPLSYYSEDNGQTWLVSTTLPPPQSPNLHEVNKVSCTNTGFCTAVGTYNNLSSKKNVLSYYSVDSGKTWQLSLITTPTSDSSELFGVSCLANGACVAVGSYIPISSPESVALTYYSTNNGITWTLSPGLPPPSQGAGFYSLRGASCTEQFCVAVGNLNNLSSYSALIYYSVDQGRNWTPSSITGADVDLLSVICLANNCSSVGFNTSSTTALVYYSINSGRNWFPSFLFPASQGDVSILSGVS